MKKTIIFLSFLCAAVSSYGQFKGGKKETNFRVPSGTVTEPEMVNISGGTFTMGSNNGDQDEQPVHTVTVGNFRIGKYEITYREFSKFAEETHYTTDAESYGFSHIYTFEWERRTLVSWKHDEEGHPRLESDGNKPVIHVSWNDATAYCKWLSKKTGKHYRLPTEAEWEFTAGNGAKHTRYSWGDKAPDVQTEQARYQEGKPYPVCSSKFETNKNGCFFSDNVGAYNANELGVFDMSGNVWEWCYDWYSATYYAKSASKNPRGPKSGENKVIRGASWVYFPDKGTVTYRSDGNPTLTNYNIGFRIACEE